MTSLSNPSLQVDAELVDVHETAVPASASAMLPMAASSDEVSLSIDGDGECDGDEQASSKLMASGASRHPKMQTLLAQLDQYEVPLDRIEERTGLTKKAKKQLRAFYERQNERVAAYREVIGLYETSSSDGAAEKELLFKQQTANITWLLEFALKTTILMIAIKVFSSAWSGSVAVVASAVDSVLDLLSQGGLVLANRFMERKDSVHYPIGKSRLESLAVLSFAITMGFASVFLVQQSVLDIVHGVDNPPEIGFDGPTIGVMVFSILVQCGIVLKCKMAMATARATGYTHNLSAVDALEQDQVNDIVVTMFSTIAAAIATYQQSAWFLDPIFGILVALWMLIRWSIVLHEQFLSLLGKSADQDFHSRLTYLAMIHDERILKVDTVVAYTLGTKIHCEVHIVLPADMPLVISHDIGESLEKRIEAMEEVELAWVHIDVDWQHSAEHDRRNL